MVRRQHPRGPARRSAVGCGDASLPPPGPRAARSALLPHARRRAAQAHGQAQHLDAEGVDLGGPAQGQVVGHAGAGMGVDAQHARCHQAEQRRGQAQHLEQARPGQGRHLGRGDPGPDRLQEPAARPVDDVEHLVEADRAFGTADRRKADVAEGVVAVDGRVAHFMARDAGEWMLRARTAGRRRSATSRHATTRWPRARC